METFSDTQATALAFQRWGIRMVSNGKELHGPCPVCAGGKDRFVIWLQGGNYYCRKCLSKGFLAERSKNWKPDPLAQAKMAEWMKRQVAEQAAKLTEWQSGYQAGYVQGWHDAMTDQNREFWASQGIPEWALDFYGLGYCRERSFRDQEGGMHKAPAYVIPIHEPIDWNLVNVQYRVAGPLADSIGKYRQENDIPAASFFADPKRQYTGDCIVLEGAKKAIVIYDLMGFSMQVVGWPSMTPAETLIEQLKQFERVFMCLDPEGPGQPPRERVEARVHRILGDRLRVMSLGMKPDDAVVQAGMNRRQFENVMRQAWKQ